MSIVKVSIGFALLWAASVGTCVHAESLRCGNRLVLPGDTRMEVRKKCGEPGDVVLSTLMRRTSVVDHGRATYGIEDAVIVPVEVWTYNFGTHRFMYRLRFVAGMVEGIEAMGYGYNEESIE